MPELPEVQTVVSTLQPALTGRRITSVTLGRQDVVTPPNTRLCEWIVGRHIASITRRGKRIVFCLDNAARFYIHLGMSGRLTLAAPGTPLPRHTHFIMRFDASPARELRFTDPRRFGGIWWLGESTSDEEGMGPEPLTLKAKELAGRLAKTARPIKNTLLDQSVIAGLGNIYVDESLYAAGIHPLSSANSLAAEQVGRLNRAIKRILRRAIRHRGSTLRDYRDANGQSGNFQQVHRVYARAGKPCLRCHTPIERIVLGGRSTHFCPHCQPSDVL
jgi:formamidopyrimidine-DNA glycosylase